MLKYICFTLLLVPIFRVNCTHSLNYTIETEPYNQNKHIIYCWFGPNVITYHECRWHDLNGDGDVDLKDYAESLARNDTSGN